MVEGGRNTVSSSPDFSLCSASPKPFPNKTVEAGKIVKKDNEASKISCGGTHALRLGGNYPITEVLE